ncbi:hypothetical protein LTR70_003594 [Exophiala xenobiotica]|nr:hypothetical protein LTR70_003594 [Exophiala xenobiotica]
MTSRAGLSPEDEAKIQQYLESPDPSLFSKEHVVDVVKETGDMVIVRAATLPENDRGVALSWDHIITLGPLFFSAPHAGSMSTASITTGHTRVDALARESRLTILLHEFLHVESVANLYDMPITKDEIDAAMERWLNNSRPQAGLVHIPPSMRGHESRKAYGMDYCTWLLVQDYWQGTNRTENNCDSWTLCTVLKQLALANPEYDFLSQYKVIRRESLLHHCTLYNCMRPKTAARIQDLPGYDARQDLWARKHGDWTPENAKKLLEALHTMVEEAGIDLDRILKETGIDIQDGRGAVATNALNNMGPAE